MSDAVNHPDHYGGDVPYEVIKVIRAWGLGFCMGNALKYLRRAGKKDPEKHLEDLGKALFYARYQKEHDFPEPPKPNNDGPNGMYAPYMVFDAWDIPHSHLRDGLLAIYVRDLTTVIAAIEQEIIRVTKLQRKARSLVARLESVDPEIDDWSWYVQQDIVDPERRGLFTARCEQVLESLEGEAARLELLHYARNVQEVSGPVRMGTEHLEIYKGRVGALTKIDSSEGNQT